MSKKKKLPWWVAFAQHVKGNPIAFIASGLAIYSWYNSHHAATLADQKSNVIRELKIDSALARSERFPPVEWRMKRFAKTDSIVRSRHPELYDSITFIR